MKKLFLLSFIVLLTLFITPLNAQVHIQIGPKVGINIANITGDDATFVGQTLDSKTGFSGGIFSMFQFGNIFAVQPEVYYTMKGATLSYMGADITFTFDYIEVPLLLKVIIPVEDSNIRPSIVAGPVLGFNTTAEVKGEANGQTATEDISDDVQSTDFSLLFGGGIGFMLGIHELGFDIRYILGLKSWDDSGADDDVKNSVINFNVYFGFSVL
jgi:hypothetical protein